MRLIRLRSECPDTESCPSLYRTDRGTAVVQGYVVIDPEVLGAPILAAGETAVEVPFALFEGLTISDLTVYSTERGTALVRGTSVTDLEALDTLRLPIGETAVELDLVLPASLTKQEVPA